MKGFLILNLLVVALASSPEEWENFKLVHGKDYGDPMEERYRMEVFERNKAMIKEHNKRYELGLETYKLGMNKFGDLTEEEFAAEFLNEDMSYMETDSMNGSAYLPPANLGVLPANVDWRSRGAVVTRVVNQGTCGACYAISAAGALESHIFLKGGNLVALSSQQIVDCSYNYIYKNKGCKGGFLDKTFQYIKDYGLLPEEEYPYIAKNDWRLGCRYNRAKVIGRSAGYMNLPKGDEAALAVAVANAGPVAIGMQSKYSNLRFYKSGIHFSTRCDHKFIDHAMVVVGYGTSPDGGDYWLVKNSWGQEWGENGYVRMARNRDDNCGVASHAKYPLV